MPTIEVVPELFSVVVLDNNATTFSQAHNTFQYTFNISEAESEELCDSITADGFIIVGPHIFEIAQTMSKEIEALGVKNDFELESFVISNEYLESVGIEEIIAKYKENLE